MPEQYTKHERNVNRVPTSIPQRRHGRPRPAPLDLPGDRGAVNPLDVPLASGIVVNGQIVFAVPVVVAGDRFGRAPAPLILPRNDVPV